jgi:hypothetical protein
MPAMPIAERRPPIVVGMRHTRSATSAGDGDRQALPGLVHGVEREREERDRRQEEHDRQAREEDVQRDLVRRFWRFAPSTIPIIRSRKVWPGSLVMRTHDPVREDARPARDGAAVAAGLADHGRALAGDRALVDRRDASTDLAVARDELPAVDEDDVALAEDGARRRAGARARGSNPRRGRSTSFRAVMSRAPS